MFNEVVDLGYDTSDAEEFVNSSSVFHLNPISDQAANYNIMQEPRDNSTYQKAKMAEVLMSLPPLGLKLHKPTSFMNMIETKLFPQETRPNLSPETNPKKASNADICLLKIGTWQRVAQNKEDLVAKCYFAKRKLMWEILENGLKRKIQMHWEHILGIRAVIEDNRPGILEIELSQPPSFFHETEPQPKKHTLWDNASDFTGGQALICRRHLVQFPHGALNKLYEKLLQCEPRFLKASQRPFPTLRSPYFDFNPYNNMACSDISFSCSGNSELPLQPYYSNGFTQVDTRFSLDLIHQTPNSSSDYSPTSDTEIFSMPNMAHWGHQVDKYGDIEQTYMDSQVNPMVSERNYDDPHSLAKMNNNEFRFSNYPRMELEEMNCSNYDQQQCVGSENTDCRFYPQHEAEDKSAYNNFDPNQTMTQFMGNQNSMCPWNWM